MARFFEMLFGQGDYSPKEIAAEIVSLQNTLPEFEKKVKTAEAKIIRLRQSKLGGGKYSSTEYDVARSEFETTKQDLAAAHQSVKDLNDVLLKAIEKNNTREKAQLEKMQRDYEKEYMDVNNRALVILASHKALLIQLLGEANVQIPNFERSEDARIFNEALTEFVNNFKRPTVFEKKENISARERYLTLHSITEMAAELLEKARLNAVPAKAED